MPELWQNHLDLSRINFSSRLISYRPLKGLERKIDGRLRSATIRSRQVDASQEDEALQVGCLAGCATHTGVESVPRERFNNFG